MPEQLAPEYCDYRHETLDQHECAHCWMRGQGDPDLYPLFVIGRREDSAAHAQGWDSCRARHIRPARESWADKPLIPQEADFAIGMVTGLACGLIIGAVLL